MTSPQRERRDQFLKQDAWGHYALSYDLTRCADQMLAEALDERQRVTWRLAKSHYSPFAIGAIALVATAFDAFLNEVCDFQRNRDLAATTTTVRKYVGLVSPATPLDTRELEALTVVRNEIVHYLPRPVPDAGYIASVLEDLDRRGLLMTTPSAPGWEVPQRLASYALAYWAFETVEAALDQLARATPKEQRFSLELAVNFTLFRQWACPPDKLPEYDCEHGISITEASP